MVAAAEILNRQTRKRLATRQSISDAATRLFFERGFDNVTIDEIAEAADVSRMTVFNHFTRKEDMFFDLDHAAREAMMTALQTRAENTSPIETLRLFVHDAVMKRQYAKILEPESYRFMATVRASEALRARARAIREELTDDLTKALASSVKRPESDPSAALAASPVVATWVVALSEAHSTYERNKGCGTGKACLQQTCGTRNPRCASRPGRHRLCLVRLGLRSRLL